MPDKMVFKKSLHISILKTIILNLHYFGLGGVLKPRIIASRNCMLKQVKGKVTIDESRVWLGFESIGFNDPRNDRLIWDIRGRLVFKGSASFYPGCKIVCMQNGSIEFGKRFSCNTNTKIVCNKRIKFGNDCLISWDCTFLDTDFHKILMGNVQTNADRPIIIGDHVWICSESLILKGSTIPSNSVIGARSLVSRELIEENAVYYNNHYLKQGISWEK